MANMTFKTNLLPNSNLEYNLGSTNKKWNIYGRLSTTSKDIEDEDKLIITDGNDYYSTNITFDGATEDQYLTQKGTFASAPVESVAGMSGDISLYTLAVGNKSYNGSENIVVTMADLGISSAMRFLGITNTSITEGSTTTPVNIVSGGSLGEVTPSNGDVILTQTDQIEYIYTGSEWKELGLASSYALRHHSHGNIITDGTIVEDTAVASGSKLVITDASNKVARSNISFGTSTTKALSNAGTWISVNNYTLPTASSSTKGGIKIGSGLTMTGEVLAANVTGVKGNAETSYRTGNVNLTAANIGAAASNHNHDSTYVNVTGDTMTGNLQLKTNNNPTLNITNTDMDTHTASLTAAEHSSIYFRDKNSENNLSGYVQCQQATNGNVILSIASRRRNTANDGNVANAINLTTAADGTLSVSVSTPAGWRAALGLGARATDNTAYLPLAGGTMTGAITMNKSEQQLVVPYNGTNYDVLHNHNNGNYSLSACGNGLYMGYYNTNLMDWLSGKMSLSKTGNLALNNGLLQITNYNNTLYIGNQNADWCHFSSSKKFYFNQNVEIHGQYTQYAAAVTSMSWINGRDSAAVRVANYNNYHAGLSMKTTNGSWEIGVYSSNVLWFTYCPDSYYNAGNNAGYSQCHIDAAGRLWGAVWNDYAEMRNVPEANDYTAESPSTKLAGRCVRDVGDGTMILTTERLQRGGKIVSDTFGFNIGETEDCKTPIAVSGRALVYIHEGREVAAKYIGWPVGTGPDGTVSIMTEEEEEKYPSRIVGTISEIPNYETWGDEHIAVNGRIWIYVK